MVLSSSPYQRRTQAHLMTAWLADNSYQLVRQSKYSNGGYRAADYIRKSQSAGNDKKKKIAPVKETLLFCLFVAS